MAGLASARSMRRRANCGFRGVASAKYGPARSRGFGRTNCAAQRMSTSDSGDTRMHAGSTLCGWSARCVKNKAFRSLTIHEILVVAFRPESRPPHLQVCETARRKAGQMSFGEWTPEIGSLPRQEAVRTTRKVRGSPWPERDPELRALWAEGLLASEIGRRLGVSKDAAIGRVHRLNLPSRPSPLRPPSVKPAPRPRAALKGSTLPPLSIQRAPPKKPVFVAPPPAPAPVKITRVRTCL